MNRKERFLTKQFLEQGIIVPKELLKIASRKDTMEEAVSYLNEKLKGGKMEKKIKLTEEQMLEKEVQLRRLEMQKELNELTKKHVEMMIETEFPMKQAKMELNNHIKQMGIIEHNIEALKQQLATGEM